MAARPKPATDDDGVTGSCEAGRGTSSGVEREIVETAGGEPVSIGSELAKTAPPMRLVMLDEAVTPVRAAPEVASVPLAP